MIKKYNIALLPQTINNEVVTLAQKFFFLAHNYLLGAKSLPHVTLYQFEYDDSQIDRLWETVCDCWKDKETVTLMFDKFSCISFDKKTFWVSLLPNHNSLLHEWHASLADTIKRPRKSSFDPHMTLINSLDPEYESKIQTIIKEYEPIKDKFHLALGLADDVGQFLRVIKQYESDTKVEFKRK